MRRTLGLLLRLYPSAFRSELGQDLIETALHRRREAIRRRGRIGAITFWMTEGCRFAWDGLLERLNALPSPGTEIRHAWRQIRRAPSQHLLAIVTLALGVGATVTVSTLADAVVFRPLPYDGANALYLVRTRFGSTEISSNSLLNLRDLQPLVKSMAWLAGAADRSPALTDATGESERAFGLDVSEGYLTGLGGRVSHGRMFGAADHAAGAERVAVVSHALWVRRWGGNPSVLGSSIRLDGVPYVVVGVMSSRFRDPEPIESGAITDVWVPARLSDFNERDDFSFQLIGRLANSADLLAARADLEAAGRALTAAYPANRGEGADLAFTLYPLHDTTVGAARDRLLLLLGAVILLLLLACANAANLFLARGVTRSPELAVRSALGATRSRLGFQLLTETSLIAAVAGAAGGLLGMLGLRAVIAAAPPGIPRLHEIGVDVRVFSLIVAVTFLTAVIFGVLPALRGARAATGRSAGPRLTSSAGSQRVQSVLVAVEVALSLVLLTGAALLLTSFRHLLNVPPGFDAKNVMIVEVRPPYQSRTQPNAKIFYKDVVERTAMLPGVTRAALAFSMPGRGGGAWTRVTPDTDVSASRDDHHAPAPAVGGAPGADFFRFNAVSASFFGALEIPIRAGRLFAETLTPGQPLEVVLNEAAARRFFPGVDWPVGRRVALGANAADAPMREVVGIVGDIRQRGPAFEAEPQIYLPYDQGTVSRVNVLIEPAAGTTVSPDSIRRVVREVSRDVPVDRIELASARYAATQAEARLLALLLTVFAAIGLALAAIGTYATVSHAFSRRVREMAIRLALGAHAGRVFRLVLARALGVAAAGIAAGLVLTILLSRALEGQLHGVTAGDPLMIAAAAAAIAIAVAIAALRPAVRAARVDPNVVLRVE